jgi:hypothetical protein
MSALRATPNLEDQVSSDRVTHLHPHAPGFIFLTFYYSQG